VSGPYAANGYEDEWRLLAAIVAGAADPPPVDPRIDDIRFAVAIAMAGRDHLLGVTA
jgi:hypothetical protein